MIGVSGGILHGGACGKVGEIDGDDVVLDRSVAGNGKYNCASNRVSATKKTKTEKRQIGEADLKIGHYIRWRKGKVD
jgi:hypothetical protein